MNFGGFRVNLESAAVGDQGFRVLFLAEVLVALSNESLFSGVSIAETSCQEQASLDGNGDEKSEASHTRAAKEQSFIEELFHDVESGSNFTSGAVSC